jgi:hypothetical protein
MRSCDEAAVANRPNLRESHSLRYFTITKPADLDAINANLQLNGGKVIKRLQRCMTEGRH